MDAVKVLMSVVNIEIEIKRAFEITGYKKKLTKDVKIVKEFINDYDCDQELKDIFNSSNSCHDIMDYYEKELWEHNPYNGEIMLFNIEQFCKMCDKLLVLVEKKIDEELSSK